MHEWKWIFLTALTSEGSGELNRDRDLGSWSFDGSGFVSTAVSGRTELKRGFFHLVETLHSLLFGGSVRS